MTSPQRLPTSLTPLDRALDALLNGVEPVAPAELPLAEALRCIAAGEPSEPPPYDLCLGGRILHRHVVAQARHHADEPLTV